jgi:asparagine N-glycosylation enzyme membrane subunit Stt3
MCYGVPAFLLQASALLVLCFAVGRRRFRDPRLKAYRAGWVIATVALIIAGLSVHFWNAIYCLVMFLQGSGVWLLTVKDRRRPPRPMSPATQAPSNSSF